MRLTRNLQAVLAAVVSLGAAVGVVAVLKCLHLQDNSAIALALLLLPWVVYGIVSGRVTELRGPGGLTAIFSATTRAKLIRQEVLLVQPIEVQPIEVGKEFLPPKKEQLRLYPNALKITVGNGALKLPICEYLTYVGELLASQAVRYVIFVDASGKFVSMVPVASISKDKELIGPHGECMAGRLIEWIASRDKYREQIGKLEGFVWSQDSASFDWSRRRCLEEMVRKGVEALPVVEHGKIEGIVERFSAGK